MRKIIERIASEDSYDSSNFVVIKNKKSMARERSWSSSSNKLERNISTKTNSTAQVSDNSAKGDSESDDLDGDRAPNKCKVQPQPIIISKGNSSSTCPDHLDYCLQYWQDIVYPTTYKA